MLWILPFRAKRLASSSTARALLMAAPASRLSRRRHGV
jgi:hypothetical protein